MYKNLNWFIIAFLTFGLFIAFYINVSCPAYKTATRKTQLESSLESIMKEYGVTGCSLVVIKNKKNLFTFNYGFADIAKNKKMTPFHAIRLASVSKLLTSILLLNVTENNPKVLQSTVSTQLGIPLENPYFKGTKITLRELLTHTSSFVPYLITANKFMEQSITNPQLNISDLILKDGKFYQEYYWDDAYPPKERYNYSGFNFILIATIMEKLTNQRFNQIAHSKLINELELKNTHLSTSLPYAETKYAIGYQYIGDQPTKTIDDNNFQLRILNKKYKIGRNPTIHAPQAGFRSNVVDLSQIMIMLLNNGQYKTKQILNQNSINLLETPAFKVTSTMQRGLGSEINYGFIPNVKMVGHSGNAYGILTHFFYNREKDFGVIFIINGLKMQAYEEGGDHLLIEKEIEQLIYKDLIQTKDSVNVVTENTQQL